MKKNVTNINVKHSLTVQLLIFFISVFEVLDNDTIVDLSREIQNGKVILCDDINEIENDTKTSKICKTILSTIVKAFISFKFYYLGRNETLVVMPPVYDKLEKSGESDTEYSSSFCTQFSVLLSRKMKQFTRNTVSYN